jgi:hypothetical protein
MAKNKTPTKKQLAQVAGALTQMIVRDGGLQLSLDLPGVPQLNTKLEAAGIHIDDADFLTGILDGMLVGSKHPKETASSYAVGVALAETVCREICAPKKTRRK